MSRIYSNKEIERMIEVFNSYPGNLSYAAKQMARESGRDYKNILAKYRKLRYAYPTQKVISALGISTPNGVTRWTHKDVPTFTKIRRFDNIKHLLFK